MDMVASRPARQAVSESSLTAAAPQLGPVCDETVDLLLSRARDQSQLGTMPRHDLATCLRAVAPILTFIHDQVALCHDISLRPEVRRAVLRIAKELECPSVPPLSIPTAMPVEHEEAVRTGALLLAAYRAAVERAEGSSTVASEFGCHEETRPHDSMAVGAGIARFLAAAVAHPHVLGRAGLTGRQLAGLEAQERVLRAHAAQRQAAASTDATHGSEERRRHILHLALEQFFGRYEAAVQSRLAAQPALRQRGLRLSPTRATLPRSDRPAYSACQMTDSGRLVFVC